MIKPACILFCRCRAGVISSEKLDQLSSCFKQLAVDVFELNDLCAFSVNEKEVLQTIMADYQKKIIVACYPRAVENLFRQAKIAWGDVAVLNFKELDSAEIEQKLQEDYDLPVGEAHYHVRVTDLKVPAWFPVIDESRCTLCGQCARFCLFGVYSYNRKSLKVINPLACKNNCPACGRTCPASAIIFPRLAEKTPLAGAEPARAVQVPEKKGGLFVLLNERNQNRKSIFREGVVQLAEEERRKALEALKQSSRKEE
ncbi:ATP-binding protein [Sunxiuqinia elliptica]|uniref:4Fe-4S binding protein n=1 Tax=Sunxiuqinia elliptica TaxID=655355 RepID=A0A4R6H5B2_9BACT|nr:4Fe-4S binding protein [Sunxiuqinia elliptica]TDO03124.1 4Fe-4S binding protein [Sunxiuqinia elliptica]TDO59323.1 4Fe-4S binding protein [Sunxiuqinia elliptica]